jgi:uncharacterized membrane protein YfcA
MNKKTGFRNGIFFLIGALLFSITFRIAESDYAHVFGVFLLGICAYMAHLLVQKEKAKNYKINPMDVTYMCIGVVFDSFSQGFPFSYF